MSIVILQKEIVSQQRQPCLSVRALFFMGLILLMANPGGASADSITVSPSIPNSLTGDLESGLPMFFKICLATLFVGEPHGFAKILGLMLDGPPVPKLNNCGASSFGL